MKKLIGLMLLVFVCVVVSSGNAEDKGKSEMVMLKTEFGNMKIKLYDETPEHKNNFLKLVGEGFYDGLLFHRVINKFMAQGGDPNSREAQPGQRLGGGSPGYTIPAEFAQKYFHKRGALAAARKGGSKNPEKRSSGSQFYIVQGLVHSEGKLDTMEMAINSRTKNELMREKFTAATEELNLFRSNNDEAGFNECVAGIRAEVDSLYEAKTPFSFSPEQRQAYTSIGGYPSLDGEYTVFGEVVEGFDVLEKIANSETDQFDRPKLDIKMELELIK